MGKFKYEIIKNQITMKEKDRLILKFGTVKGFSLNNSPEAFELMKKYYKLGVSFSVMAQRDTPEQKDLICQIIDKVNGDVINDWDGEVYESKEDAKKYITEYHKIK